jgi:phenylacetate-CoA ligase
MSNPMVEALAGHLIELRASERQTPEALAALQRHRLDLLTAHLEAHSGQFRLRLREAGVRREELLAPQGLQGLPVMSRRTLQNAHDLFCATLPQGHGPIYETQTSGSTGEPVVVRRTAVNGMDWMAVTMREHLWHKRDFLQPLCAIRANFTGLALCKDWGPPVNWLFPSGPLLGIPVVTDIGRQIELILEFKPRILLIYPSNLTALLNSGIELPSIRHLLTIAETLSPQTREHAGRVFGSVTDTYSSQELGTIAIQCPESPLYHVMAENLIVEVLKDDGTACRDGETGRVVATDLRNFATPIVRYDVGDVAEVGPPCPCGRGLPTLSRIFGRVRNLVLMPDGTRHWPLVGFCHFREVAPVMQYQFIQDGRQTIELRLVTERPLDAQEEAGLAARVRENLGFPFAVRFTYFAERLPAGANGKFEEFVCRVAA